jgi:hypothetical protein
MEGPDAERVEENVTLLIQAALDPSARPAAGLRRSVLRRLLQEAARSAPVAFPDGVVVLLGGLLLAATGILAWLLAQGAQPLAANPALMLPALGLALNLVLVPAAGLVIVLGRKRE